MSSGKKRPLSFCIELYSRDHIKRISLPEGSGDRLLIEGFLGGLVETELIENIMLEIKGTGGVIRLDLTKEELDKTLRKGKET